MKAQWVKSGLSVLFGSQMKCEGGQADRNVSSVLTLGCRWLFLSVFIPALVSLYFLGIFDSCTNSKRRTITAPELTQGYPWIHALLGLTATQDPIEDGAGMAPRRVERGVEMEMLRKKDWRMHSSGVQLRVCRDQGRRTAPPSVDYSDVRYNIIT